MEVPLEDFYEDIIGKAQRGLGLSDEAVASKAGISTADWKKALNGAFDEATARAVAPVLNLNADALVAAGKKAWKPNPVDLVGLDQFNTPFDDMTVNAYVAWDPESKDAVLFDSGGNADPMIELVEGLGLKVQNILLTHTHPDHIYDLPKLQLRFPNVTTWVHESMQVENCKGFSDGKRFQAGSLKIEARHTPGHSKDGVTFAITGLAKPVAIVGDAIFSGSMGGAPSAWKDALAVNREKIFSLPEDTIVCPGHGPMSSVGEESRHNPYYAS
ncbi:MAG: MBL fold metallo-hydrolase [Opitutales bacterium]|nr:MBL fold metallo-hydrolase [Opitutales bacterium]